MKITKLVCAVVAALIVSAVVAGCSTYHPVGAPREGVVASRVVV